ncbi:MAG: ArsR/SmtB family transcription factor [Fimbriimonas sp.]
MDELKDLSRMYKALGDPTRLRILQFLRSRCCPVALGEGGDVHPVEGPTVGEVCCQVTGLEKINSTISFHIRELKDAGLITVEKRGKYMVCGVNRAALSRLADFLCEGGGPDGQGGC